MPAEPRELDEKDREDLELGRAIRKLADRDFEWDSGHGDLMPCFTVRDRKTRAWLSYEGDTLDLALRRAAVGK